MSKVQTTGLTLGFATSSWTAATIISYSKDGETAEDIDTSDLATTNYRSFEPGDLKDGGTYTFGLHFDAEVAELGVGVADTATVTFPISNPANATNATEVFACYINNSSRTGGINELINGTVTLKVNGGITFIPETT